MAVASTIVWEIRSTATANNVNGGGFKTGATGTDFSQQDAAQYALTGLASAGAGNVVLSASAAADMVGNIAKVVSGTNFTAGWFEITSVSVGVSFTCSTNAAGTAISTGVGANGVINIGGALSMASTLDDDVLEEMIGGNIIYAKKGNYTIGEAISVASASSTTTAPIKLIGYNATRGDNPLPSSGNQPVFICGANGFTLGPQWIAKYISVTATTAFSIVLGTAGGLYFSKITNTSTSASQGAIAVTSDCTVIGCEIVSQNGTGIVTGLGLNVSGCYFHDSVTGILTGATTGRISVTNCLFESINGVGVDLPLTSTGAVIEDNTFYGAEAKSPGIGVRIGASAFNVRLFNNIFYGWTTGVSQTGGQLASNMGAYNSFFNNTTNATNYTLDSTDLTTNPAFVAASQLTGSTANTSGSVLTQAGGDFSTVTDNVDYLRVVSGTGVTVGTYLITSHTGTTVTTNNALGTSSANNDVWVVPVGHNLAIGTALKAAAFPGAFGAETTSYFDTGGVQRLNPGGGSGVFGG